MKGVRVDLSSGDRFYVLADLEEVSAVFSKRTLMRVGSRFVNATQVAQLTVENVPSTEIPERLED